MWFVIFQGISQPLNGKGLHETFAVENFLVVMALCTVLTCLPVMPVNSARRGECWLHFLELTPLIFLSLIVSLCTPGPPVISQTCLVTSAIACSQGGRGEMLHRWEWRRAVVRHFCISFTRRKKKKPEIDRTVPFFWHQQNYPREMRTDLGLLSSGASIMKSKSYKNERMYFKAPSCCHRECKDHLPALALPLYGDRGGGWWGKVDCGEHFSRLSCLQYESATGNGGE